MKKRLGFLWILGLFLTLMFNTTASAQVSFQGVAINGGYAVIDQGSFGAAAALKLSKNVRLFPSAKFYFGNNDTEFGAGLDLKYYYYGSSNVIAGTEFTTRGFNVNLGIGSGFPIYNRPCYVDAVLALPDDENYAAKFIFGIFVF